MPRFEESAKEFLLAAKIEAFFYDVSREQRGLHADRVVPMNTEFVSVIPILRICDTVKAKDFYVGFLGFTLDWEHKFDERSPVYLQISKQNLILHLTEHHGDCCPGSTVFVWMKGIEEFHSTITSRGYGYMRPGIEKTFYNSLAIEVTDPFGNRIRFNEDLTDRAEASPAIDP